MQRASRRDVIKTTGAGAGMALGAGAAGGSQTPQFEQTRIEPTADERTVLTAFESAIEQVGFALDAGDPEDTFDLPVGEFADHFGTECKISGNIYEDGSWETTVIELPDGADIAIWLGLDEVISIVLDWLDIEGFLTETELSEVIDWVLDIVEAIDFDEDQAAAITDLLNDILDNFDLELDEWMVDMALDIIEDVLEDPEADTINDLLDLLGIETLADILDLVGIDAGNIDGFILDLLGDTFDLEELLGDFGIDIDITEITGQMDPEAGVMSATLRDAGVVVTWDDDEILDFESPVDLALTSDQSGGLQGSTDDMLDNPVDLTLVNNEFEIGFEEFGLHQLISVEDIASPIAWVLDLIFDVSTEDVADVLESIGIDSLIESANLDTLINWLFQDEAGRHSMVIEMEQTYDDVDSLTTLVAPPPIVGDSLPQDLNGDGLYEDIRGDGEVGIYDVQTLFKNLDNEDLQAHSEKFNFSGDDPDEVGIFDVQSLFLQVQNG